MHYLTRKMGTKRCSNCRQEIEVANFVLHELRCRNYCTYCELCDEAVPNETLSEHQRDVHTHKPCPLCGQSVLPRELEAHKDKCPYALILCKYCDLEKPRKDLFDHMEFCGSRTEPCDLCTLRVKLCDMQEHQETKCGHVKAEPPLDPFTLDSLEIPPQPQILYQDNTNSINGLYMVQSQPRQLLLHPHSSTPPHSDSELARMLQEEEELRDRQFGRDLELARQLQNEQHYAIGPPHLHSSTPPHSDSELARMLQEEEQLRDRQFGRDLELARQLQEESSHTVSQLGTHLSERAEDMSRDKDLARRLQLEEDKIQHWTPPTDSTNTVELPCQFCGGLYPIHRLTLHQNSCGASSGGLDIVDRDGRSDESELTTSSAFGRQPATCSINEQIPCESCGQLFALSSLHRHQVVCSLEQHTQSYRNGATRPRPKPRLAIRFPDAANYNGQNQ